MKLCVSAPKTQSKIVRAQDDVSTPDGANRHFTTTCMVHITELKEMTKIPAHPCLCLPQGPAMQWRLQTLKCLTFSIGLWYGQFIFLRGKSTCARVCVCVYVEPQKMHFLANGAAGRPLFQLFSWRHLNSSAGAPRKRQPRQKIQLKQSKIQPTDWAA